MSEPLPPSPPSTPSPSRCPPSPIICARSTSQGRGGSLPRLPVLRRASRRRRANDGHDAVDLVLVHGQPLLQQAHRLRQHVQLSHDVPQGSGERLRQARRRVHRRARARRRRVRVTIPPLPLPLLHLLLSLVGSRRGRCIQPRPRRGRTSRSRHGGRRGRCWRRRSWRRIVRQNSSRGKCRCGT